MLEVINQKIQETQNAIQQVNSTVAVAAQNLEQAKSVQAQLSGRMAQLQELLVIAQTPAPDAAKE